MGRKAFAEIGFPEPGPTGASIREVLTRAARWSTNHGYLRVSHQLTGFIAVMDEGLRGASIWGGRNLPFKISHLEYVMLGVLLVFGVWLNNVLQARTTRPPAKNAARN